MAVQNVTEAEFDAATARGVTLVDFWAPWCGPCKMMGAVLETRVAPAKPALPILKVNVDEAPLLAARFGVQSIPTLLILSDGALVRQYVGVTPPDELLSLLSTLGV